MQDLKTRTRDIKRTELAVAAFDLMVRHGYDALTVEELAKGVGVSRATFFRYLGSKDEVAVAAMVEPTSAFAAAFADATSSQSLWDRIRAAFEPSVTSAEADAERVRARILMVRDHPELGDRLRRARMEQIERLVDEMVEQGEGRFAAEMVAAAAVALLDRCISRWAETTGQTLAALLDEAFAELSSRLGPRR
ncbi:TetR/AcrR family transcriptional regulator [Salipiger sp. IMCC34102]|uniref:TetR/AcrR family transcriptional regulator n=1 Tax=Salipiger sp. IMCC34102 TaxID=2510647 RepID=UPI00101C5AA6|nr:TetR/AcrR family transcriptional regulator [Salipiger sp. IMCC34102]RYH01616.1 TetR/AcrR family transcriptional regulator [Salipiger sp. IMCC34102]